MQVPAPDDPGKRAEPFASIFRTRATTFDIRGRLFAARHSTEDDGDPDPRRSGEEVGGRPASVQEPRSEKLHRRHDLRIDEPLQPLPEGVPGEPDWATV